MTELRLSDHEFQLLRRLVHCHTGIVLGDTKRALVEARLRGRLRELGLPSFLSYYRLLSSPEGAELEAQQLVNRITTNITAFFRELPHFTFLAEQLLPGWLRRATGPSPRLRLWSAGCATGEEAYSIAAVVRNVLCYRDVDAKILATDVSSRALLHAELGCYTASLGQLPPAWRSGFLSQRKGDGSMITVADTLRQMICFRLLNLLTPTMPFHGRFDAIFCRNVLIYFDPPMRQILIARFMAHLAPAGCLFLGMSEGLVLIPPGLVALGQSIYRLDVGGGG